MKPNQKNRYNGRYNNRNSRMTITRNTALESTGPMGKVHGTALQLFEKYQSYAKDALIQNDLVLAQTCMQYADHYMRMQNIAIANEQAMRAQNAEQRPAPCVSDKTDSELPLKEEAASSSDRESKDFEEEQGKADVLQPVSPILPESQAKQEVQPLKEEAENQGKTAKEEKVVKKRIPVQRKRVKKAAPVDIDEDKLPDEEILKRDLSVPILVMQSNNAAS